MKKIVILLSALLLSSATQAEDNYDSILMKAVMGKMSIAWDCRKIIGGGYYQAARSFAISKFTSEYDDRFAQETVALVEQDLFAGNRRQFEASEEDAELCLQSIALLNITLGKLQR